MATEIIRWCDAHLTTDERVPGAPHAVDVDGKAGTIDLCPDHVRTLLGPLLDIMAPAARAHGGGRKPDPGDAPCVFCDHTFRGDRLAAHISKQHGTTLGAVYGNRCPLCTDGRTFHSPAALGSHARGHSMASVGDLWAQVARDGDPDGRLAALRTAAARGR